MSKGLDKLQIIRHIYHSEYGEDISMDKDLDIIEKELKEYEMEHTLRVRLENINYELVREKQDNEKKLKALKIIKNKPWLVSEIVESKGDYKVYKSWCSVFRADMKNRATEEEYDLLKEVLL